MSIQQKLIVITGPTASGKSELAIKLAKKINGEIISADSRQIYKELDIGTAKIKGEWCTDIASPQKRLTVIDWKKCAEEAIAMIYHSGKIPILVGGTMFYIKALIEGWTLPQVPPNPKLRKKLENYSTTKLFNYLTKLDPKRAKTIERKNRRRLIRALEIIEALGKVPKLKKKQKYDVLWLGIKRSPTELKKRIEKRINKMLRQGLIKEVKNLKNPPAGGGLSWKRLYEFGFEYKYPALYLQKKISKDEVKHSLVKESLDYVRRQLVWFKKENQIKWVSGSKDAEKLLSKFPG